jgi:CRP/FNR family transcriptional regulator, cyclic AMP receptor protein
MIYPSVVEFRAAHDGLCDMQRESEVAVTTGANHSLKDVALFAGISSERRRTYEQRCTWRSYRRGEQVIRCETESRHVFFVISGSVRVVNHSRSGRDVTFAHLNAGDLFGELAAIDGRPRCAEVVATSQALLAIMAPDALCQIIGEDPSVALAMIRRLAGIVRVSNNRIMELSTLGAHNRVHAEILRMAKSAIDRDGITRITPAPTHSDIASRVSTSRETVARVLGDLGRKGIVARRHDSLVVTDPGRLADMVEHFSGE